jgi:hypothetical protein
VLLLALGVVLFVQVVFVASYVGALHAPKPHGIALGVVGAAPVATAVGKEFSLTTTRYASESAARHAIDQRKIDGAFVAGPSGATLIVAPAAGPAMASSLGTAFAAAAVAFKQPLRVVTVHPLPSGDSGGTVSFLVVMALIVGGYLSATMAMAYGGGATKPGRLAALACAAVLGALLVDTVAGPVIGALPTEKFLALWGLFIIVMMAVAFSSAALQSALGPAGTLIVVIVFVILGAPASGGPVPRAFLPGFWRVVGPYLPAGAGTDAVRNTLYFGGNALARPLIVLAAYLIVGAIAVIVLRDRRAVSSNSVEAEAAAAAAAVV